MAIKSSEIKETGSGALNRRQRLVEYSTIPSQQKESAEIKAELTRRGSMYAPKTVGNTPMPTAGSSQPHGYGHTASQRDGHLRLSGDPKAHRIGKR